MTVPNGLFANPRPVTVLADLLANVWQLGYVTTDIDRATEFMADTRAELGHWLEICQLQREDIEFFTALVTDSA